LPASKEGLTYPVGQRGKGIKAQSSFVPLCLLTWEDKYLSSQNYNNLMTVSIIALSAKATKSILSYKVTHNAN